MVSQLWPKLINPRNEQGDTKWSTHHGVLVMHGLSEPQGKITNSLCYTLHLDALVERECMVLGGYACVVDHSARVRSETRHCTPEMRINFHDLFNGGRFKER